uniref:Uncharacterized protein n=1 Tax=Astatotilapia calliptera TaxID=8154 RepID=A0A3P8Q4L5_ASTCA
FIFPLKIALYSSQLIHSKRSFASAGRSSPKDTESGGNMFSFWLFHTRDKATDLLNVHTVRSPRDTTTRSSKTLIPSRGTLKQCDYDPCLEGQISCFELAASSNCLCPGFTLNNVPPEAPKLSSVSWNGSEVVLQWCTPYSFVTAYVVTVGGQERQKFEEDRRSGGVGEVGNIAEVCVVAVNDAGASEGSCMMYHPRDNSLPLTAGLIGGALGFLLLLLLAVLLWRHKRQRKQEATISMHNTAETR